MKKKAATKPIPAPEAPVQKAGGYATDNPIEAEKLQKGSGIIPSVTGNRLEGNRKYIFAGLTADKAKEILK